MLVEQVKIVVVSNGQKFAKVVDITSDGAYWSVDAQVNAIVNRDWEIGTVQNSSWSYV